MALPITLNDAKAQCRIPLADTAEDALLQSYLVVAGAMFEQLSKRSFDATGDEELTANELAIAGQWLLLMVAHFYETRQPVITDVRAVTVEVPKTLDFLMDLIRVPTL
ncbi:head-tail connector protein [Hymenobacter negativus]|uniref:Phage gp6-like head-tail connector protein n=1 Tax=Hymenobacter negativus TaxID=2795026 RepID=A0ABS0Q8P3_9BACT|nr:head-tail connector protein [Hymenobacter negativus]MBH8558990.1 phage gp6-like head-tail connector protein [Hymenobacter negativus]